MRHIYWRVDEKRRETKTGVERSTEMRRGKMRKEERQKQELKGLQR